MRQPRKMNNGKASNAIRLRPNTKNPEQPEPAQELPVTYTLRVMLAGQPDYIMLSVSRAEHDRVMEVVQFNSRDTFILIQCLNEVAAIQLRDLALVNFCFDVGTWPEPAPSEEDQAYEIHLYLKNRVGPLAIEMEPDRLPPPGQEEVCGQLYDFLSMLESSDGKPGTSHFLEDGDGEPLVILEHNLSMVRIPNCLIPNWPEAGREEGDLGDLETTSED